MNLLAAISSVEREYRAPVTDRTCQTAMLDWCLDECYLGGKILHNHMKHLSLALMTCVIYAIHWHGEKFLMSSVKKWNLLFIQVHWMINNYEVALVDSKEHGS